MRRGCWPSPPVPVCWSLLESIAATRTKSERFDVSWCVSCYVPPKNESAGWPLSQWASAAASSVKESGQVCGALTLTAPRFGCGRNDIRHGEPCQDASVEEPRFIHARRRKEPPTKPHETARRNYTNGTLTFV